MRGRSRLAAGDSETIQGPQGCKLGVSYSSSSEHMPRLMTLPHCVGASCIQCPFRAPCLSSHASV